MKTLSKETIAEMAIKMTILDAIEKGKIKTSEDMNSYMESETFEKACKSYMQVIETNQHIITA